MATTGRSDATSRREFLAAAAFGAALAAGCPKNGTPATKATGAPAGKLTGEGATFIDRAMQEWVSDYAERSGGKATVNYKATGSGAGVKQFTEKLADFGCSDAPMNKDQLAKAVEAGGAVIHIPLVIGAVVPIYNLPGLTTPLVFDGPLLAALFTGRVTKWNDPRIARLNPGVALPAQDVQAVYRSDPSGSTYIFADYLGKTNPDFKGTVGVSNKPNWPAGVGTAQNKSDGVIGYVARTEGTVGYVELTFALDAKVQYGAVVNAAGKPAPATAASITAAAAEMMKSKPAEEPYSLHEFTYNLTNAPGAESFPIAGMSFAILFEAQPAKTKDLLVDFLKYCAGPDGQALAEKRNYAALPPELQAKIAERLGRVTARE